MKLGFASAILPDLSLDEVLRFAADEHFETVEVMCWPSGKAERKFAGVTHLDVSDFGEAQAAETLALVQKHGVSISALGYYPNVLDPDPLISAVCVGHLKKVIAAALKLGLAGVNTFAGRDWTKSADANWPRLLEIWRPLVEFAEEHGVRIGIENCPMLFTADEWPGGKNIATTPEIWRRMFSDIPSPNLGLNYDPSHFALQMMDPVSPLAEFQSKLFHMHAKDVKLDRARLNDVGIFSEPLKWHRPCIPGAGEIDWTPFMGALKAVGYDGPICIEIEDESFGKTIEGRKLALQTAYSVLRPLCPASLS